MFGKPSKDHLALPAVEFEPNKKPDGGLEPTENLGEGMAPALGWCIMRNLYLSLSEFGEEPSPK